MASKGSKGFGVLSVVGIIGIIAMIFTEFNTTVAAVFVAVTVLILFLMRFGKI